MDKPLSEMSCRELIECTRRQFRPDFQGMDPVAHVKAKFLASLEESDLDEFERAQLRDPEVLHLVAVRTAAEMFASSDRLRNAAQPFLARAERAMAEGRWEEVIAAMREVDAVFADYARELRVGG